MAILGQTFEELQAVPGNLSNRYLSARIAFFDVLNFLRRADSQSIEPAAGGVQYGMSSAGGAEGEAALDDALAAEVDAQLKGVELQYGQPVTTWFRQLATVGYYQGSADWAVAEELAYVLQMDPPHEAEVSFEVDAGTYTITAEKEGYFKKSKSVDVEVAATMKVKMPISEKPAVSSVVISKKRIAIKKKIHFETNSDEIKMHSFQLLDEVADVLTGHTELKLVEIQGHTDDRGKKSHNIDLSQRRAESVRRYLINAGVEEARLQAKGFGPSKPLAPNITAAGRARNRRVEFHILERGE